MSDAIDGLTAEIDDLRERLEREQLDADAATEVLERITALAQRALTEIEQRTERLEDGEPAA